MVSILRSILLFGSHVGTATPPLPIHRQKERHDEQNPDRRGYLHGWESTQKSCLGRVKVGEKLAKFSSPLTVSGSVCEADAAGFLFFSPVPLSWMAGRGSIGQFGAWSDNKGVSLGVWQPCLEVRHRLGDWWFCLVILQINTESWCAALMGIACYQWVMVCSAAHGDWGSMASLVSKDPVPSTGGCPHCLNIQFHK